MIEVLHFRKARAHLAHLPRKRLDGFHQHGILKVLHHFLTILDAIGIFEGSAEERSKVIFVPIRGDGLDDLVEIQIAEKSRSTGRFSGYSLIGASKQNAMKGHPFYPNNRTKGRLHRCEQMVRPRKSASLVKLCGEFQS